MTGITSLTRDYGVNPSIVRMQTTDTLATVANAGYITSQYQNIYNINYGNFSWSPGDSVQVYAADGSGLFSISSDFSTLNTIATTSTTDVPANRLLGNPYTTALPAEAIPIPLGSG